MRPAELDVTFSLDQIDCAVTEDSSTDEPYLWVLWFKVDRDTIGPPKPGSLVPTLNVQVFEGQPISPFLNGGQMSAGDSAPIPAKLGNRTFRVRPDRPVTGWFPGLAGVICLLWDQDAFAPSTAEAGYKRFRKIFGPTLAIELNNLLAGAYDDPLSRNADGNVVADPTAADLNWRLDRMGNADARRNAVKAITRNMKGAIKAEVTDAVLDAANWDELIDKDDALGADAAVFMSNELATPRNFTMTFTDDEANYTIHGHATSTAVHPVKLESTVTSVKRTFDRRRTMSLRVCWFPPKRYWAYSYTMGTTTRFELRTLSGPAPLEVRWFLDQRWLAGGSGTIGVAYESADTYYGPPRDRLAAEYPGGPGALHYRINGPALEIWNDGGEGFFFGQVQALYTFNGDPGLPPNALVPFNDQFTTAYDRSAELSVAGVDIVMDARYQQDVHDCGSIVDAVNRKHIAANFGKAFIDPGDPPFDKQLLHDIAEADKRMAVASNVQIIDEASGLALLDIELPRPRVHVRMPATGPIVTIEETPQWERS
jgi:hypothetical protein